MQAPCLHALSATLTAAGYAQAHGMSPACLVLCDNSAMSSALMSPLELGASLGPNAPYEAQY